MVRFASILAMSVVVAGVPAGCASAQPQARTSTEVPTAAPGNSAVQRAERGYTGLDIRSAASVSADGTVTRAYPVIRSVEADSPGHRAGFAPGDVILEINGADSRQDRATLFQPGMRYSIRIRRLQEEREVVLVPGPPATATNRPAS